MRTGQILALITVILSASAAHAQVGKNEQVANPNIVNDKILPALPVLNSILFKKIVAARPMANTAELGAALGNALTDEQKTELYTQMFIPINLN